MNAPELLNRFIVEVLNERKLETIRTLFVPGYVDHDPIDGRSTTIVGIELLVRTLQEFGGDVHFVLEQSAIQGQFVWYKLYGEGVLGSTSDLDQRLLEREHLVCTSVGLFRLHGDKFAERWGVVTARRTRWRERVKHDR